MDARPDPRERLPAKARTLWRLEAAGRWAVVVVIALTIRGALAGEDVPDLLRTALWVLPLAGAAVDIGLVPQIRWRRWRYAVREDEIDLRHGTFTVVRTLVPMARVQHVDTHQGLLEQSLDLSTVVFHTAAGATTIPALRNVDARELRDRIASLARAPDTL